MAKKKAKPVLTFSLGDRVEILHFGRGKIVELRGPLGPGGAEVYRVRYRRKPKAAYIEVLGSQLRPAKAAAPSPAHAGNGASHAAVVAVERADADFPVPGTPEWGVMNRRRGELIHKKNRAGLTPDEWVEYERLQRLSLAAIQRAFPAPTVGDEQLARIEARLGIKRGADSE
jgi:hypothetical protein